jgi:hypothetical protein
MKLDFFYQFFCSVSTVHYSKKTTTFITLDLFLERGKYGLFTLLPEVGSRSGC